MFVLSLCVLGVLVYVSRPATCFGSCREGVCVCVPTGDLLSGLVGRVCLCICPDWQPAFGSCREGVCCVCVPTGDLLSGLVGRVCVCVCVPTGDLLSVLDIIYIHFYNHNNIIIMRNVRNKSCFCRDFTFL